MSVTFKVLWFVRQWFGLEEMVLLRSAKLLCNSVLCIEANSSQVGLCHVEFGHLIFVSYFILAWSFVTSQSSVVTVSYTHLTLPTIYSV